jgi:hypothetical protein
MVWLGDFWGSYRLHLPLLAHAHIGPVLAGVKNKFGAENSGDLCLSRHYSVVAGGPKNRW